MMGVHHTATGAAACVAISPQLEVLIGFVSEKLTFLPDTLHIGLSLMGVSPIGVITGAMVSNKF